MKPSVSRRLASVSLFFALSAGPSAIHAAAPNGDAGVISALVTAEETLLSLQPKMQLLSSNVMNLELPGPAGRQVFAANAKVWDLGPAPLLRAQTGSLQVQSWPVRPSPGIGSEVKLWKPLFDALSRMEQVELELATGEHPDNDMFRYASVARFHALGLLKSGEWCSLQGRLRLEWQRPKLPDGKGGEWKITSWQTEQMDWTASPRRFFVETLDQVMRNSADAAKLRRSIHQEATINYYRGGMKALPHPYFAPISVNQKEGVSIVDIDGDGNDDIYITVRLGKNLLLRNHGDGTFSEEAALHNLDLPGHNTCALFADFDNDGDLDLILGRSLLKTTYLENRHGWFYQHPIPKFMPMAVISMAAADYNNDGLLDVYLCTYRPAAPAGASPAGGVAQVREGDFDWPDEFFSPEMAREFRRRLAENRKLKAGTVLDQIGPPNLLLINKGGGKFEPAPENSVVGVWRNSLQATWGDFDNDGDPDLFVANDWAPSSLFRNDGTNGFREITAEAGVTSYGFSMGASWGDYDNDGLEDIYVSNMYSEAGRRMAARIPGLSQMFRESASGNWLYHQTSPGKFRQVAGMESPAIAVLNAGWSWGGCFIDFDNDTFQDLYVLSGYFTAPKALSSDLDLESNLWRTMLRTDENLARPSFRSSPEWKRTGAPDSRGAEIDARLAGVERQGERIVVHSLNGNERNHFFLNRAGKAFDDVSALSGLDNIADSRGFAVLDYDHDGFEDVALVNANSPMFNLYHNEMASAGRKGGMLAIRFVGGNRSANPTNGFACRDGFGTRVTVDLGSQKVVREHRCGDGWSIQNSATMIVGVGGAANIPSVSVKWASGKVATAANVPEGTLLTVYENAAEGPNGAAFARAVYRRALK